MLLVLVVLFLVLGLFVFLTFTFFFLVLSPFALLFLVFHALMFFPFPLDALVLVSFMLSMLVFPDRMVVAIMVLGPTVVMTLEFVELVFQLANFPIQPMAHFLGLRVVLRFQATDFVVPVFTKMMDPFFERFHFSRRSSAGAEESDGAHDRSKKRNVSDRAHGVPPESQKGESGPAAHRGRRALSVGVRAVV